MSNLEAIEILKSKISDLDIQKSTLMAAMSILAETVSANGNKSRVVEAAFRNKSTDAAADKRAIIQDAIKTYLKDREFTCPELVKVIDFSSPKSGISKHAIYWHLKDMVKEGKVLSAPRGNNRKYGIGYRVANLEN